MTVLLYTVKKLKQTVSRLSVVWFADQGFLSVFH